MTSQRDVDPFLKLVQRGDMTGVRDLVTKLECQGQKVNVNLLCRSKSGDSALHIAAQEGHVNILSFLIKEMKGNLELVNLDGKTPLHYAAQFSHLEVVKCLLDLGANVMAVKKADWTPLMLACTKSNLEVVQVLLHRGSDPTFRNKDGWNALHIAAREGHMPVIRALLECIDPQFPLSRSRNGRTPVHTAVMHGHGDVVQLLLERCAPLGHGVVDARDSCQTTPLMDACRFGVSNLLETLVDKYKADTALENSLGMNCLHIAAEAGQNTVLNTLVLKYKMEVNKVTVPAGLTPLHFASRENHVDTVQQLLQLGANPKIPDSRGHSCIDLAETLQNTTVLRLLQKAEDEVT